MILSEQIKLCRKQLGMSQADLADAIWVSRNTVSNWERNRSNYAASSSGCRKPISPTPSGCQETP